MTQPYSARFQPVLGTELHVLVGTADEVAAERVQKRVLGEILRLEALLSTYRDDTPLVRWMRAETDVLPDEVIEVLALAQHWFLASAGALNPGLGRLQARWREAERDNSLPSRAECSDLAAEALRLPFTVRSEGDATSVHRLGDCSVLNLDALAKGWIVDRAAEVEMGPDVGWLMVNVGGDLRLEGSGSTRVAIENPASHIDNAPPLTVVRMTRGGLASSGAARRGFRVGGAWFGHIFDPPTGWPVGNGAGATVIAADTVTADALATVVGVRGLDHPMVAALLDEHEASALVVDAAGAVRTNARWPTETN